MAHRRRVRVIPLAFALALALGNGSPVLAQAPQQELTPELKQAREALSKYENPIAAVYDGYFSTVGCVQYAKAGAEGHVPYPPGGMGVHFLNVGLLGAPLDPAKPQILVYEPVAGGKLKLAAAEWFIPLSPEMKGRPELFGKPFDGPMEGHHPLMPLALHHYDLHVWLWKDNPAGMFSPTNPKLKCPKGVYTLDEAAPRIVSHK